MSLKTLSYNKQSRNSVTGFKSTSSSVAVGDPYWNQVELCLLGNGTNNLGNSTFLDRSTNAFTITKTGSPTQGSLAPFNNMFSVSLNGSTDNLIINGGAAVNLSGDFTIEFWVYWNNFTSNQTPFTIASSASGGENYLQSSTSGSATYTWAGFGATNLNAGTFTTNTWYHVAIARSGSTIKSYQNGVQIASGTTAATIPSSGGYIYVGSQNTTQWWHNGYISDLRILKGTALYTGTTFTLPTSKLTAITNTALLLNFDNVGVYDSSPRKLPIYTQADAKASTSYSKYGTASISLDGTGDYLSTTLTNGLGSGDFTVEFWHYRNVDQNQYIFVNGSTADWGNAVGLQLINYLGNFAITCGAGSNTSILANPSLNTWHHIAIVRYNGVVKLYLNGTASGTTISDTTNLTGTALRIGNGVAGSWSNFNGYIDDLRITRGLARYVSNFIVPQAEPVTSYSPPTYDEYTYNGEVPVSGDPYWNSTQLLLRGNAANGLQNNIVIDTSSNGIIFGGTGAPYQGSFAPSNDLFSVYFSGSSSYLESANATNSNFGTNPYTVEFWVNTAATSGAIYDGRPNASGGGLSFGVHMNGANRKIRVGVDTSVTTVGETSVAIPADTWTHIAFVREGTGTNQSKIYINGVLDSSYTDANNYVQNKTTIGTTAWTLNGAPWTGYLSNFRIVKGTAVYTSNFTPSTTRLTAITNTSLLLNFDNVGIYDSANKINLSTAGTAAISTVYKKYGAGSMYFDGSSYVTSPNNSNLNLGSGNFTIEAWVMLSSLGSERAIVAKHNNQAGNGEWLLAISATNFPIFYYSVTGTNLFSVTGSTAVTANTWHHIAIVRNGSSFTIYLNGISGGTATDSSSIYSSSTALNIGRYLATASTAGAFLGYIDDVRITKGIVRYTGNFTPPTVQLPNYYEEPSYDPYFSNVSLLLHGDGSNNQNNSTIVDSSTNNATITRTGNPSQGSFSPFPVATNVSEYSVANNSGSIYLTTSDYFYPTTSSANYAFSTGDFTIEAWVYATSHGTLYSAGGTLGEWKTNGAGGFSFGTDGTGAYATDASTGVNLTTPSVTPSLNTWNHLAISRSGSSIRTFLNGSLNSTTTYAGAIGYSNSQPTVGRLDLFGGGRGNWTGYVSNLRVLKGTALYTAAFTVPNTSLTAITNTQLLLKGENSAIYDSTTKNNLIVSGDTKTMVAINKYGGSSIYFDGAGDYISLLLDTTLTQFGTGDFTVETWVYPSSTASMAIFSGQGTHTAASTSSLELGINNSSGMFVGATSYTITNSVAPTANTWSHVAFVRSGGSLTAYLNGNQTGTIAVSGSMNVGTTNPPQIGVENGLKLFSGYMDDFRITKGIARYNGNFVPPTASFKNK